MEFTDGEIEWLQDVFANLEMDIEDVDEKYLKVMVNRAVEHDIAKADITDETVGDLVENPDCSVCGGAGTVFEPYDDGTGRILEEELTCQNCGGSGVAQR